MTTEDDFQRQLDAHPEDHHTRLVFADWLEERDDPRAEGYRAMGVHKIWPAQLSVGTADGARAVLWLMWNRETIYPRNTPGLSHTFGGLPADWFALAGCVPSLGYAPNSDHWRGYNVNRAPVEDDAALAFAKLPPTRRAELLRAPSDENA